MYIVLLNGSYMNCFKSYSEACELREILERRYGFGKVTIENAD